MQTAISVLLALTPPSSERTVPTDVAKTNQNSDAPAPAQEPDGSWSFTYGFSKLRIVCAPLRLCDVALQAGEKIKSINVGDSARWLVQPSVSGTAPNQKQHLLIKPTSTEISTTLTIHTDRRSYNLELVADPTEYMAKVSFRYPKFEAELRMREQSKKEAEEQTRLARIERNRALAREKRSLPRSPWNIDDISFDYEIRGEAQWKPVRVYSNAHKTIIEFPSTISSDWAPVLLRLDKLGWLRYRRSIVNYRIDKNRYVVDGVFGRSILISGVGVNKRKIVIIKGSAK